MPHTLSEDTPWPTAAGDREFGQIYRDNVNYVWRVLGHLGVRSADLEDVAHDVFLVVRRRLCTFEARSSLRTWIYGISVRVASDYRSRAFRKREVLCDELPEMPLLAPQQEELERSELNARLSRLLDGLKPEQREVFVLYEIEELSMKEVALSVGCPLQTAYSRLHAAREQLRTSLARKEEESRARS